MAGATAALTLALSALSASPGPVGQVVPGPGGRPDLLRQPPLDRITLIDGTVLSVEPVNPRPLPPPPKADDSKQAKPLTKKEQAELEAAQRLVIRLTEGDYRDFIIKKTSIKSVEYFEDMLLAEGDRWLRDGDFPKAFEHYLAAHDRSPGWKGIDERIDKLLFAEGDASLIRQDAERGLRLLRELLARRPDYPGLVDKLAKAYSERINRALDRGLYAEGRQALHDLETIAATHVLARDARKRYVSKAQSVADRAASKAEDARLVDLAEALRIWPELEEVASKYADLFEKQPTLDVGVLDLPPSGPRRGNPSPGFGPWVRSQAETRVTPIIYWPLLARDDEAAARGNLSGQLVADLEIADIGRTLNLRLRPGILWSDGSRPVSSIDVARSLSDRAIPQSPSFSARWAGMLERLEAGDDERVTIRLTRPILNPEAWLVVPIGPAHAGRDGLVPTPQGRRTVGDGLFRLDRITETEARFQAATQHETPGNGKIRYLREVRMPRASTAIAALIRGEVSMLEHVPPDRIGELTQDPDVKIGRYAHPSIHRIVLDGRTPALRNRSLRRGLSYAIDRVTLLEESVLRRPPDPRNTVADGPFPTESHANAPQVRPLEHDPLMAKMLIAAGRKELGNEPIRLRFEYPAIPEAQAAAPKIAELFREAGKVGDTVGLTIELIERRPAELEQELRAGRRFDLVYLADRVAEPAFQAGPLICPGYDAPPSADALAAVPSPRILQLLLQLERAVDPPSARDLLQQIDREAHDELPILPLWQLEDHYAWRGRLTGPAETAESLYQGIESWEIKPWFARDPWSLASP
jgi:peptide/nickel transport system substrate-binding protein